MARKSTRVTLTRALFILLITSLRTWLTRGSAWLSSSVFPAWVERAIVLVRVLMILGSSYGKSYG